MITKNDIRVNSATDIAVLNNRYAVIRDVNGIYRVVSLVRSPATELQPRTTGGGISYVFNRTGTGPSWDKQSYNQQQLAGLITRYGKAPAADQMIELSSIVQGLGPRPNNPWKTTDVRMSAGIGKSDIAGMPFLNTQLDPQKGGWVIATVTPEGLLFGSKPKVHTNEGAANAELQRLATVSPGTEFVLLKATKTAITQTVQTRTFG